MKARLLNDVDSMPDESPENWAEYIGRNIAKVPALAYETARSGLGAGNILEEFGREAESIAERGQQTLPPGLRLPTAVKPLGRKVSRAVLPPTDIAHEEVKNIFPRYYVEKKEGDYPAEFLLKELPLLMYTGAFKSIPSLYKGIVSSASILGGSELGKRVGGYIGEQISGESGKRKGEFVGGLTGGITGSTAAHVATNRPSKFLKERTAVDLDKEFNKSHEALIKERNRTFENIKKDELAREQRIKELETSRHPEYAQAERAAVNIKDSAPEIRTAIKKLEKNLELGVETADRNRISEVGRQVENLLRKKDLTLDELKTLKKNLNAARYDKSLSPVVKNAYSDLVNATNETISRLGEKYPEHGRPFASAEQKTIELKKLKSEHSDFLKHQKEAMRDVNENYKNDLRNLKNELSNAKNTIKQQETVTNTLKPFVKTMDKAVQGGLGLFLSWFLGFGTTGKAISAFAAPLLKEAGKNAKAYYTMFTEHPDIIQDYNDMIAAAVKNDTSKIVSKANIISEKMKSYQPEEKRPMKARLLD